MKNVRIFALLLVAATAQCWSDPGSAPLGYERGDGLCNDGRDNDRDGQIDCEDSDCLMTSTHCAESFPIIPPRPQTENGFLLCTDGVDNDGDGQFDCGDRGCQNIAEVCCSREFSDELCSNGLDDDGNGYADCQDFSCRNGTYTTVCARETNCTDLLDNDGDGRTD